ncbi:MAG: right-handed parallel beta-helix repeat-containing protein [Pseudomonadota bacterium]
MKGSSGGGNASEKDCSVLPVNFTQSMTIPKGCYFVEATPSLADTATLTLSPGVTLVFAKGTGLVFRKEQRLIAVGREDEPIVLTGAEKTRGFWQGVVFEGVRSLGNRLKFVKIEYAGAPIVGTSVELTPAGLWAWDTAEIRVDDTVITESAGDGFAVEYGTKLVSFENNTITRNAYPGLITFENVGALSASSTFSGNDDDALVLFDGDVERVVVPALDVPYLAPKLFFAGERLVLEPGVQLRFDLGSLTLYQGSSLQAEGTAEKPIVLTGSYATPGAWGGVELSTGSHVLRHVTVEYGGRSSTQEAPRGNLRLVQSTLGTTRVSLTDCTLQKSASYGLWAADGVVLNDDFLTANHFSENASGDTNVTVADP